jgi:hypothetical protein
MRRLLILLVLAALVALLGSLGRSQRDHFIETCENSRVETDYNSSFSCEQLWEMTHGKEE